MPTDAPADLASRLNRVMAERDYFMAEVDRLKLDVARVNIRISELESVIARMRDERR